MSQTIKTLSLAASLGAPPPDPDEKDPFHERLAMLLMRDEGVELIPYLCPAGKTTIGVGRNLDDTGLSRDELLAILGRGITREEAMMLLDHDIARVTREVEKTLPWSRELDGARKAVLLSMAFNLGLGKLLKFTRFLNHLAFRRYDEAAREMLASRWALQVGERARRLARMMETGDWA